MFWDLFQNRQQETEIKPWQLRIRDLQGRVIFISPRADLVEADLRGAGPLIGADFRRADAVLANFEGLDCRGSSFVRASLRRVNFRNADLTGCDFEGADLEKADFTGATVLFCRFGEKRERAKLEGVKGLDLIKLEDAHIEVHGYLFDSLGTFKERRKYAAHLRAAVAKNVDLCAILQRKTLDNLLAAR